jgi:hypothetical protein
MFLLFAGLVVFQAGCDHAWLGMRPGTNASASVGATHSPRYFVGCGTEMGCICRSLGPKYAPERRDDGPLTSETAHSSILDCTMEDADQKPTALFSGLPGRARAT